MSKSDRTSRPPARARLRASVLLAAVGFVLGGGAPAAGQQTTLADARRVFVPVPVGLRVLADNVFQVTGNGNSHLIHTSEGNVVFDTGNAFAGQADDHYRLLRDAAPGPIRYVIYSHSHPDHIGGHRYWATENPEFITHREFEEERRYTRALGGFGGRRVGRIRSGLTVRPRPAEQRSQPRSTEPPPPAVPLTPDILIGDGDYAFELGGVRFEVLDTPGGEGPDNVSLWLPQQRILFTGDTLGFLWEGFPNLFTMRGEKTRKPVEYIRTIERLIALEPDMVVPGHHDPIRGRDNVLNGLRKVRDAVRYVHDAVIAGMNGGKTVHQVMAEVTLPPELDLHQGHGKVSWGVKSIWEYYGTWFHFDSTAELYHVPARDVYEELAELAGTDPLLARARQHLDGGRPLHALHIIEVALSGAPEDAAALQLYVEVHERLLTASEDADNAYEQGYLQAVITETEETLENLQSGR